MPRRLVAIVAPVVGVATIAAGCSTGAASSSGNTPPSSGDRTPSAKGTFVVPKTTKILRARDLTAATVGPRAATSPTTITFPPGSSTAASLRPGDVVVSGITPTTPLGLLVKVTAVHGNQVHVVPATLTQALSHAHGTIRVPLPTPDTTSTMAYVSPAPSQGNPQLALNAHQGFSTDFDWNQTYKESQSSTNQAGLSCDTTNAPPPNPASSSTTTTKPASSSSSSPTTTNPFSHSASVTLTVHPHVHLNFGAYLDISANWDWGPPWDPLRNVDIKAVAGVNQSFLAELSASLQGKCSISYQGSSYKWGPFQFSIGPVPVVIQPTAQLVGGLNTTSTVSADFSVNQNLNLQGGAEYNNSGFNLVQSRDLHANVNASASFQGDATVKGGPVLGISFYGGAGGVTLALRGYLEGKGQAQLSTAGNPCGTASLDIGLQGDVGVNLNAWIINKSHTWSNVLNWGPQQIWSGGNACPTPPTTTPPTTSTIPPASSTTSTTAPPAPTTTSPSTTTTTVPTPPPSPGTGQPGHDSPGDAVAGLVAGLQANNVSEACSYTQASEQPTCDAFAMPSNSPITNFGLGTVQVQGTQALVVVTGTFCDTSVNQCSTNTDPNAGLDPGQSFAQNYQAALGSQNEPATGQFAIPCVQIQGQWYVTFTL